MEDQLINEETYELALEKGLFYKKMKQFYGSREGIIEKLVDAKPTQTFVQRWLRKDHGIHVYATHKEFAVDNEDGYYYHIGKSCSNRYYGKFDSYELALEQGLFEGLKQIK